MINDITESDFYEVQQSKSKVEISQLVRPELYGFGNTTTRINES